MSQRLSANLSTIKSRMGVVWLLAWQGPTSSGTMKTSTATPSTTTVISDLKDSTAVAFTVEPGNGSPRPTGRMLSELPLT